VFGPHLSSFTLRWKQHISPNRRYQSTKLHDIFGKFSVRISAGTPAILTDELRGFPLLLEPNAGIVPRLGHYCCFPNLFQFTLSTLYSLTAEGVLKEPTKGRGSKSLKTIIGFKALTAVSINSTVFWIVQPCISEKARRFREHIVCTFRVKE
jgi:hypothetical protein